MKLKQLYNAAIQFGMEMDPRGEKEVKRKLKETNSRYEKLSEKEKKYYDEENLANPYADSRINHDAGNDIKTVLAGIDIDVQELLLADKLSSKSKKIDAVFAHHPVGKAYANFYEVMGMQADIFAGAGVTISIAESLTEKRLKEVGDKVCASNHYRCSDAAKLLDISLFNMHTPADNCVSTHLQRRFDKEKPATVGAVLEMLYEEKEYAEYAKRGVPPVILGGNKNRTVKKVFVDMTGGTEGAKEIFKPLIAAGVDTVVGMHFSPDHKKAIEEAGMNAVIAGHISSDALGMNLLLDAMEKKCGKLDVIETSGFIRVKRNKK